MNQRQSSWFLLFKCWFRYIVKSSRGWFLSSCECDECNRFVLFAYSNVRQRRHFEHHFGTWKPEQIILILQLDTCLLLLLVLLYVIHKLKCLLVHSLHHSFNKMVGFHVFYWIIHGLICGFKMRHGIRLSMHQISP